MAVNGLNALSAIGIDDAVRDLGFVTRRIRFTSGTGKELGSLPLGPRVDGAPRTVLRADLYDALRRRALDEGIPVHHGHRLIEAAPGRDGVTAVFDDGTEQTADLLVGADGLRSTGSRADRPLRAVATPDRPRQRRGAHGCTCQESICRPPRPTATIG